MTTSGTDPRYDSLAELALGTLPEPERAAIEAWLAGDADARAEFRALRESLGLLALSAPIVDPPTRLRDRVLAITGRPAGRGHAPASAGAAVPMRDDFTATTVRGEAPRRGLSLAWIAAAAAVVVAIGLGFQARKLRSQVDHLQAALGATAAQLATVEAEARLNRTRLARAQAETSILTASDLRRVDLAGQQGAPRAAARAFWSRAQGLVLTATRLPELPAGRTYQLWVLTSGAPVSAGIFRPDASGGTSMVFDTPVSLPTPAGMAVSVEPEGGVASPTGDIVLLGKAE
jgi:anti-sigma-K factor RskA